MSFSEQEQTGAAQPSFTPQTGDDRRKLGPPLHVWSAVFRVDGVSYITHDSTKAKVQAKLAIVRGNMCPVPIYSDWLCRNYPDVIRLAAQALRLKVPSLDESLRYAEQNHEVTSDGWFFAARMGLESARAEWLKAHPTEVIPEGPQGKPQSN